MSGSKDVISALPRLEQVLASLFTGLGVPQLMPINKSDADFDFPRELGLW